MEKKTISWPFWLQIPTIVAIPLVFIGINTPTNVLNSSSMAMAFGEMFFMCMAIQAIVCLPVGIIGLVKSRKKSEKMGRLRFATQVLSCINIGIVLIYLLAFLLIILAVMLGASV